MIFLLTLMLLGGGCSLFDAATTVWPCWLTCDTTLDSIDLASDDNYYVFVGSHLYTVHATTKDLALYEHITDVFATVQYPVIAAFSTASPSALMFIIDSAATDSNVKVFQVGTGNAHPYQPQSTGSLDKYFPRPPMEPGLLTVQNLSPLQAAVGQSSKVQFRGTVLSQPGVLVEYSYVPVKKTFDWVSGFNSNDPVLEPWMRPAEPETVQPWMHVVRAMTESGPVGQRSVNAFGSDGTVTRISASGKTEKGEQQVPVLKCPSWMAPVIMATCCEQTSTPPAGSEGPTIPPYVGPGGLTTPQGEVTTPAGAGILTTPLGGTTTVHPGGSTTLHGGITTSVGPRGPDLTSPLGGTTTVGPGGATTPYVAPGVPSPAYPLISGSTTDPTVKTTTVSSGETTPSSGRSTTHGLGGETTPDSSGAIFSPPRCSSNRCCQSSVVVVEGWRAIASGTTSAEMISLGSTARSGRRCLRNCKAVDPQCRLVSFDFNTQKCSGFIGKAVPRFQRDISAVVLADTEKIVYDVPSSPACQGSGLHEGAGNKIKVDHAGHREVCKLLCVVHPWCVYAMYDGADCELTVC